MSSEVDHGAEIGRRIRFVRQERGYGVRELAKKAGVDPGTISWLEGGRAKSVGFRAISRIANALEVPKSWLVWGEGTVLPSKDLDKKVE